MDFNYLLVLGNSGQGKTTYAKTVVKSLKDKGFKVYAFDPNRQTVLAGRMVRSNG